MCCEKYLLAAGKHIGIAGFVLSCPRVIFGVGDIAFKNAIHQVLQARKSRGWNGGTFNDEL